MPLLNSTSPISDKTGTVWAYVQNWSARGITIVVFFVLARLLTPAEFGAFAVATIFVTLGEVFVEQLFGHVIVQRTSLTEAHLSSAFWATLAIAATLVFVTFATAPIFASAFDSPGIEPVIMSLTPIFIFMALASVPGALLRRELNYRTLARRTALSNLLSGIVAIIAAANGLGIWSFVLQQLVFQSVGTWVLWRHESWRPQLVFQRSALGELFRFTSKMTLVKLLDLIETRVVELVIARYLGVLALGNYALASRAQQSATQLMAAPLWESSISIFARKQGNQAELAAALNERAQIVAFFITPAFLFAAVNAAVLVPTVFGDQWRDAIVPFQILCILGAVRSLAFLYGALLQAVGEAGASLRISIIRTTVTVCALPLLLSFGPSGVAGSLLIGQLVALPFVLRIVFVKLGLTANTIFQNIKKPLLAACIAAVASLVFIDQLEMMVPELLFTVVDMGFSIIVYISVLIVISPQKLSQLAQFLPKKITPRVTAALNAAIRLEDSVRAFIYLCLVRSWTGKEPAVPTSHDIVLIFGDSSSIIGSVGDQALFGGLMKLLQQAGITHARVLCRPGVTLPRVGGVTLEALPLWGRISQARLLARELAGARALIVVGADTLDGFYSRFESLLRLGIAAFTARQRIPTVMCSFSFNDQPDPATVEAFKKLPPSVSLLCRDSISRDRLVKLVGDRVQLTTDLAYLLEPAKSSELDSNVSQWLSADGHLGAGPVIGWNLSPHSLKLLSHEQQERAAACSAVVIARLVTEHDASVVLIPHDFRPNASDPAMLLDIYSRLPATVQHHVLLAQGPYAAADVKQVCAHFDLILTGRMHLMIAALGCGVPIVAIEYQGKFSGALAHFHLGREQLLEPETVCNAEQLYNKVCARLNDMAKTRAQINARGPIVKSMSSKKMTDILMGAL